MMNSSRRFVTKSAGRIKSNTFFSEYLTLLEIYMFPDALHKKFLIRLFIGQFHTFCHNLLEGGLDVPGNFAAFACKHKWYADLTEYILSFS